MLFRGWLVWGDREGVGGRGMEGGGGKGRERGRERKK